MNFKNVLDTTRKTIPFGIAQIGPAFRNEITPGNFIFRAREFEQMEIEYFVKSEEWEKWFEYWLNEQKNGLRKSVLAMDQYLWKSPKLIGRIIQKSIDTEFKFPFGQKELYGLAYRTDYDLANHQKMSGQNLEYTDPRPMKNISALYRAHVGSKSHVFSHFVFGLSRGCRSRLFIFAS